jgi:hypothetical protein
VSNLEILKQRFNAAKTFGQRQALINQAGTHWRRLVKPLIKTMPELKEDYLKAARQELRLSR